MKKVFILALMFPMYLSFSSGEPANSRIFAGLENRNNYERFVNAIIQVESKGNPLAVGKANDVGLFQITPIRLADYNRRTGKAYKMNDMFNPGISREIFDYYHQFAGSFEESARRWNRAYQWRDNKGLQYWNKVSKHLNN